MYSIELPFLNQNHNVSIGDFFVLGCDVYYGVNAENIQVCVHVFVGDV
jgi:hypothetical protein